MLAASPVQRLVHTTGGEEEGGLASGGDCLRISDALTVTPTVPQQLGGVGVVSSFPIPVLFISIPCSCYRHLKQAVS